MPALEPSDIKIYYSSATSVDTTKLYLGGYRTTQELSDNYLHNFFQKTTHDEEVSGIIKFRCGYIYNANTTEYIRNPILFIISDTTSSNDYVAVGWGTAKTGSGLQGAVDGSIEQSIANENTFPTSVNFFKGNNRNEGAILDSDIPPLQSRAFWIMYQSLFNAQDFPYNTFSLRLVADNIRSNTTSPTGTLTIPKIEVCAIGSCSANSDFSKIMDYIKPQKPDFLFTTGDNSTSHAPQFFLDNIGPYVDRIILAFGLLDDSTSKNLYINKLSPYSFVQDINKKYYSKQFGNLHILVMDTSGDINFDTTSDQYTFVVNDLRTAFTDPKTDWIVVVTHATIYSSLASGSTRVASTYLRDHYHTIFTQYGVSVVMQGSLQFYERTKVLGYNTGTPSTPQTFTYDGPTNYTIQGHKGFADGQIYVTCGTGGNTHDAITTLASYTDAYDFADFGYVKILIDNTGTNKKFTLRFYATSGTNQVLKDSFNITRTS